MNRALRIVVQLAVAIVIALLLLGLWQWFLTGSFVDGFADAARLLFLFMDVGLVAWLVLLIVGAVRGWGKGAAILSAFVATVLNLLVVIVIGAIQQGWAWLFILFAIEAGIAFLVGAIVAVLVTPSTRTR